MSRRIPLGRARVWWPCLVALAGVGCMGSQQDYDAWLQAQQVEKIEQKLTAGPTYVVNQDNVSTSVESSDGNTANNRNVITTSGDNITTWTSGSETLRRMVKGRKRNYPGGANGLLFTFGDGEHDIWNITNPRAPDFKARLVSPWDPGSGGCSVASGVTPEAEAHQYAFARYPGTNLTDPADDKLYAATISGRGVDIWDITSAASWNDSASATRSPMKSHIVGSTCYGDDTKSVWGISWQGDRIYVGATDQGIYMIKNPTGTATISQIATQTEVGMKAGPVHAMADRLVVLPPKNGTRAVSMLSLSNPDDATAISGGKVSGTMSGPNPYFGNVYDKYAYVMHPIEVFDISGSTPVRVGGFRPMKNNVEFRAEYLNFGSDENNSKMMWVGTTRTVMDDAPTGISGMIGYTITGAASFTWKKHIPGYDYANSHMDTDDQFALMLGNVMVACDDEKTLGTPLGGCWISKWRSAKDTAGPQVLWTKVAAGSTVTRPRVFFSMNENVDIGTLSYGTLRVRKVGTTDSWAGTITVDRTTITWEPGGDYQFWGSTASGATATFEACLTGSDSTTGAVEDLVGNKKASGNSCTAQFTVKRP